jgi:hypothetical protein
VLLAHEQVRRALQARLQFFRRAHRFLQHA